MEVSNTGYGVDVSARRADELERKLLARVAEQRGCGILDVGCGAGGAAARLTNAGAVVTGVDIHDFSLEWTHIGQFYQTDVRTANWCGPLSSFDYCLCQRMLHYVPYAHAGHVLQQLRQLVEKNLYISFSGITSELATGYDTALCPITERHGCLSASHQKTFGINQPLTLYSESEVVRLLEQAHWNIDWVRTSAFGNINVVAS